MASLIGSSSPLATLRGSSAAVGAGVSIREPLPGWRMDAAATDRSLYVRRRRPRPQQQRARGAPHPANESDESRLAVHGVDKSVAGRAVIKGASLYLRRGEVVGLLGPNGAGKTTLFHVITGLVNADRGRIELDGRDISVLPMYQRARLGIGYLPQEAAIFHGRNVEDHIRRVLQVVEPDRDRRQASLDALLDEFDIAKLRHTASGALSGRERRRVDIVRAVAARPRYLLLDEPFAGLDPIAVSDIQSLVRRLTDRGVGVLVTDNTDHNLKDTLDLADRAYVITLGELV
jgi:lipopolysaccharide export system ATP-binding protein